jgi:hypothetical protein
MPRSSSLPGRKVSVSSMKSVGLSCSMTRKKAGELTLEATTERWASSLSRVMSVDLPQRC